MTRKRYSRCIIVILSVAFIIFSGLLAFIISPGFNLLTKKSVAVTAYYLLSVYDPFSGKKVILTAADLLDSKETVIDIRDFLSNSGNIEITAYDNKPINRSKKEFSYEDFDESKLKFLSSKYGLKKFNTEPDFEGLVSLRCWLKAVLKHTSNPDIIIKFNNFDALDVLRMSSEGKRFMCGEAAYTYTQCALSIGAQARVVLLEDELGIGHAVSEVWSNQYGKWIVMDPDYNIHFLRNRMPLSALELHYAYINKETSNIEVTKGYPQPGDFSIDLLKNRGLDKYFNFAVRMRNDFFRNYPSWHKKANTYVNTLEWKDKISKGRSDFVWETVTTPDLYWDINSVCIYVFPKSKTSNNTKNLLLYLDTFTPNFDHFIVNIDGVINEVRTSRVLWRLHKGKNLLEVASVNKWGVKGRKSVISLNLNL